MKWIESYLYCRTQQVKLLNTLTDNFIAYSEVPQGSNLGLLLFLIFIINLPSIFDNTINILLYAEMYTNIRSDENCKYLQNNLVFFIISFIGANLIFSL